MKQNNFYYRRFLFLLFMLPCFVYAQNTVTGTVNNESGATVPFANVIEKGTANGVTTDMDGNFSIVVSKLARHTTILIIGI